MGKNNAGLAIGLIIAIVVVLVLIVIAVVILLVVGNNNSNTQNTGTVEINNTLSCQPKETSTAEAQNPQSQAPVQTKPDTTVSSHGLNQQEPTSEQESVQLPTEQELKDALDSVPNFKASRPKHLPSTMSVLSAKPDSPRMGIMLTPEAADKIWDPSKYFPDENLVVPIPKDKMGAQRTHDILDDLGTPTPAEIEQAHLQIKSGPMKTRGEKPSITNSELKKMINTMNADDLRNWEGGNKPRIDPKSLENWAKHRVPEAGTAVFS